MFDWSYVKDTFNVYLTAVGLMIWWTFRLDVAIGKLSKI